MFTVINSVRRVESDPDADGGHAGAHYRALDPDFLRSRLEPAGYQVAVLQRPRASFTAHMIVSREDWETYTPSGERYTTALAIRLNHSGRAAVRVHPRATRVACRNQFVGPHFRFSHVSAEIHAWCTDPVNAVERFRRDAEIWCGNVDRLTCYGEDRMTSGARDTILALLGRIDPRPAPKSRFTKTYSAYMVDRRGAAWAIVQALSAVGAGPLRGALNAMLTSKSGLPALGAGGVPQALYTYADRLAATRAAREAKRRAALTS